MDVIPHLHKYVMYLRYYYFCTYDKFICSSRYCVSRYLVIPFYSHKYNHHLCIYIFLQRILHILTQHMMIMEFCNILHFMVNESYIYLFRKTKRNLRLNILTIPKREVKSRLDMSMCCNLA